ncbi:Uncharacterized protein FWK35_00020586, partial [Aphis craccivora]
GLGLPVRSKSADRCDCHNQSYNWFNNVLEELSDTLNFRRVGTEKFYCACSRQFYDS